MSQPTKDLLTKESLLCGHHFPGNTVCLVRHPKDHGFTILDFTAGLTLHLREGMDLKEAYGSYEKYCCELPRRGVLPNIHEITLAMEEAGPLLHKNITHFPSYKDKFIKSVRDRFPIEGKAVTDPAKVKNTTKKGVLEVEAERGDGLEGCVKNTTQILGASVAYEGYPKTLSIIVSYLCNGRVCLYTLDPSGNEGSGGVDSYNLPKMLVNWSRPPALDYQALADKHKAMVERPPWEPGPSNRTKFWLNGRPTNEKGLRDWALSLPFSIQTKVLGALDYPNKLLESERKDPPMKEKIPPVMSPDEMAAVEDYKKNRENYQREMKKQVLSAEEMSILDKFKDEIAASQVEASVKLIQAEKVAVEQALKDSQLQLKKLRKGKANKTVLIQTMSVSAIATLIMYFILARVFHRPFPNLKLGSPAEERPRRRKRRRPSTYEGASTNVPIALPPGREVFTEPLLEAQPVRRKTRSK